MRDLVARDVFHTAAKRIGSLGEELVVTSGEDLTGAVDYFEIEHDGTRAGRLPDPAPPGGAVRRRTKLRDLAQKLVGPRSLRKLDRAPRPVRGIVHDRVLHEAWKFLPAQIALLFLRTVALHFEFLHVDCLAGKVCPRGDVFLVQIFSLMSV